MKELTILRKIKSLQLLSIG